jgi:DNA-binding transcriptional MerR regulator
MVDPFPAAPSIPGSAPGAFTLEELLAVASERLGEAITPRTVRLYASLGLLDRPGREGRKAVYGRRHLLQLLLIRSLARRGLSLAAIAPLLGLDDGALEQQLTPLPGDGPSAGSPSTPPSAAPTAAGPAAPESPPGAEPLPNAALAYLRSLQAPGPAAASGAAGPGAGSRERSASLLPLLGSPLSPRPSPRSPSPSRSPSRSGGSREAASRWHRFTLAPGVELQISDSVSIPPPGPRRLAWLQRLSARLIEQLEDSPP